MPDIDDLVARDQARALIGLKQVVPEWNYSPMDLEKTDLLLCSRGLAGEHFHCRLTERPGELYPMTGTTRIRLENVFRRL
jgi:hypothetical protein